MIILISSQGASKINVIGITNIVHTWSPANKPQVAIKEEVVHASDSEADQDTEVELELELPAANLEPTLVKQLVAVKMEPTLVKRAVKRVIVDLSDDDEMPIVKMSNKPVKPAPKHNLHK